MRAPDCGAAVPVATVMPPPDAGPPAPVWPPPLINPSANLRMAWDLALGRPDAREILFTFDDGPNPGTTERLLDILDRHHVHAVFFVCGWRLESDEPLKTRARTLLRNEFDRGHVIGNHTVHHFNMATLSPQQIEHEVDHNSDLIEEVIGQRPHLFRPPYGSYSEFVRQRVEERHDELTLWSIDSHDWQMVGDAQGVAMNVIRLIGNMAGGTILLHDTHPWSVSAAQMVLRWIESDNREREARGRPQYDIMDAAHFFEGERARLPVIEAAREEEARNGRHTHRDAGTGVPTEAMTAGVANMGAGADASAATRAP
jgi:peptidoglycan/xylan/chitin deacetylase (PgdA/CDA1 family)